MKKQIGLIVIAFAACACGPGLDESEVLHLNLTCGPSPDGASLTQPFAFPEDTKEGTPGHASYAGFQGGAGFFDVRRSDRITIGTVVRGGGQHEGHCVYRHGLKSGTCDGALENCEFEVVAEQNLNLFDAIMAAAWLGAAA